MLEKVVEDIRKLEEAGGCTTAGADFLIREIIMEVAKHWIWENLDNRTEAPTFYTKISYLCYSDEFLKAVELLDRKMEEEWK